MFTKLELIKRNRPEAKTMTFEKYIETPIQAKNVRVHKYSTTLTFPNGKKQHIYDNIFDGTAFEFTEEYMSGKFNEIKPLEVTMHGAEERNAFAIWVK
jgi:hypothetical protein